MNLSPSDRDYGLAVRAWTDDKDKIYYVELNEAYLTIDTERIDLILGKKMMRWGTGDGINPMDLINPRDYRNPTASARGRCQASHFAGGWNIPVGACHFLKGY